MKSYNLIKYILLGIFLVFNINGCSVNEEAESINSSDKENLILFSKSPQFNWGTKQVEVSFEDDFQKFDLVIALDDNNLKDLKNLGCKNPLKLGDFGYEGACIPDPYYFRDFEEFKNVYSMIETCVIALINKSKEF